jgi:hypothetical protein
VAAPWRCHHFCVGEAWSLSGTLKHCSNLDPL